jgi:hypothetical protein
MNDYDDESAVVIDNGSGMVIDSLIIRNEDFPILILT